MSKALKWILGIIIVLLVVAVVAGIGFLIFGRFNGIGVMMGARQIRPFGFGRMMPMHPFFGFPGGRLNGFFPLRFVFGWVFCLGILALIVFGVLALIFGLRRAPQASGTPAQMVSPAPSVPLTPSGEPAPVEAPAHNCPSCGRQVSEDWSHCPYCGSPLT